MTMQFWKSRMRHFLMSAGISERILSSLAVLVHAGRWRHHWDIKRDYAGLRAQLGGGLPSVPPDAAAPRTLILSLFDEFYFLKFDAVFARALMEAGHHVTILRSKQSLHGERYFRLLGIKNFVALEDFVARAKKNGSSTGKDVHAAIRPPFSFSQLMNFKLEEFHVGEHILSTLLGHFRMGHLDLASPDCERFVMNKLDAAPAEMAAVRAIFDTLKPDNFLLQERGYLPNAYFWDEAIFRNVNFVQWNHAQETNAIVLKKYSGAARKQHPLSLSAANWAKVKDRIWTDELDRELMEMFRRRYEKSDWYNRDLYRTKAPIVPADQVRGLLGLDSKRKIAVVFSHILWDATFFFGDNLFQDYEEWLLETIKCACANTHLNWIIKLHPDYSWKLARFGAKLDEPEILRREFGDLPDHVQLMLPDSPINTYSLFQAADYCVTVRGTAGIEMSCFGRPTVTGGTGRYYGLGFTIDSASREEYKDKLATLHQVPLMGKQETMLARKFAYALYRLRPLRFSSLRSVVHKQGDPKHPLFLNFLYEFRTAGEFTRAEDLKNFAKWFSDSSAADYLSPWPEDRAAKETAVLRLPWLLS